MLLNCHSGVGLHRAEPAPRARRRPEATAATTGPAVHRLLRRRGQEEPLQVGPRIQRGRCCSVRLDPRKGLEYRFEMHHFTKLNLYLIQGSPGNMTIILYDRFFVT